MGVMPDSETTLRFAIFALVFALVALAEARWPARSGGESRARRWPRNILLMVTGTLAVHLTTPLVALAAAFAARAANFGLFAMLPLPGWLEILLAILLLDLVVYGQHRLFHRVPFLWRLHRAHHSDRTLDVSSGIRFHPGEILVSMVIKSTAVLILGAPPVAVLAFAILLNATSLFSHGNIRLAPALDRGLRRLMVTPAMHRIHHSEDAREHASNFGFALSVWDRLFGSYRAAAARPGFTLGLTERQSFQALGLLALLLDPARPERPARTDANENTFPDAPRQVGLVQPRTPGPRTPAQ